MQTQFSKSDHPYNYLLQITDNIWFSFNHRVNETCLCTGGSYYILKGDLRLQVEECMEKLENRISDIPTRYEIYVFWKKLSEEHEIEYTWSSDFNLLPTK